MFKIGMSLFFFFALSASAQTRSAKNKEYSLPLFFDVVGQGVELSPLVLHYDLQSSEGRSLQMGHIKIDDETFFVKLLPFRQLEPRLTQALPSLSKEWIFVFQWPENLMTDGVLELISRTGRVLWSLNVTSFLQDDWKEEQDDFKRLLVKAKMSSQEIAKLAIFKTQYGMRQADTDAIPFWDLTEPFKICFSKQEESGQTRLCSPLQQVVKENQQPRIEPVPLSEAPPRVILRNDKAPLMDESPVEIGKPIQFFAELRSGLSFEFVAVPRAFNLVDMVYDRQPDWALLTTEAPNPPLVKSIQMNPEKVPEWVDLFGWHQTIGDFRKFWRTRVPLKNSYLMIPGLGGGAFKQKMNVTRLPKEESRPYLHSKTLKGTYVNGVPLKVRKVAQVKVSSKQQSIEMDDDQEFVWSFEATKKGQMNRSYLAVSENEKSFRAYQDLYKGYSGEISGRLSGIVGTEGDANRPKVTVVGELAFNYWFESVLGWYHPLFAHQRWGTSFKAFQTITNLEISKRSGTLQTYTADLKYRLNQGLWGRDETWGLMASYQNFSYLDFEAQMAGGGFFWARSMPRVFEPFLNWLKFLDYPKWVDLEFIYYPVSLAASSELGRAKVGNWALNFHGQIMFTENFFGEAGFGLRQYDLSSEKPVGGRIPNFTFTSSYSTFGIGLRF